MTIKWTRRTLLLYTGESNLTVLLEVKKGFNHRVFIGSSGPKNQNEWITGGDTLRPLRKQSGKCTVSRGVQQQSNILPEYTDTL